MLAPSHAGAARRGLRLASCCARHVVFIILRVLAPSKFFDPNRWRVVLMDQRGCGSSKPRGRLAGNDTWRLVSDIEVLRRQVGVRQWGAVMGGSWGSTLALAYASQHPDRVAGLVLRGVCLMRRIEMEWFFGGGAGQLRPKEFAAFTGHVARGDNSGDELLSRVTATDVLRAYLADLTATDGARRAQAAGRWAAWEHAVGSLRGRAVDGAEGGAQAWWVVREAELAAGQAGWGAWGAGWGAGGAGWDRLGAGGTGWDGWGDEDISLAAGALRDFPGDPGLSHGQAQALLTAWYSLHLGFGAAEGVGAGLPSMRGVPCIAVQVSGCCKQKRKRDWWNVIAASGGLAVTVGRFDGTTRMARCQAHHVTHSRVPPPYPLPL